jgi:predicted amidophosphoribosyltransferase
VPEQWRTSWRRQAVHLLDRALSAILPPACISCRKAGALFCDQCRADLAWVKPPVCERCGRQLDDGRCRACRDQHPGLQIRAAVWFCGPIMPAIHQLKYRGISAAAAPLAGLMVEGWRLWAAPVDLVLPVALHPSRVRERGYNQATLLARHLGRELGLPLREDALFRIRHTRPQVGLSGVRENVSCSLTMSVPPAPHWTLPPARCSQPVRVASMPIAWRGPPVHNEVAAGRSSLAGRIRE